MQHYSVMKDEVLQYLVPSSPETAVIVDCTLGEGGHTEALALKYPQAQFIGIDADPFMKERARERLGELWSRVSFRAGWFDEVLASLEPASVDGILFDLGVSMFHFIGSGRGFSLKADEPLDMRLHADRDMRASAASLLNTCDEQELEAIIRNYGEERQARRIAAAIVRARKDRALVTTGDLMAALDSVGCGSPRGGRASSAAVRVFQALRIAVNDELGRVERAMEAAYEALAPDGIMAVISFHSLEDRLVKQFMQQKVREEKTAVLIVKKPLVPSDKELRENRASRSAKLRLLRKLPIGAGE